ncbi:MAG: tRNA (adenine-N1)-methyltransferase [Candidatus Hadarchaeales archaeon]
MAEEFKEGERAVLLDEKGRKYLVKVESKILHTNLGKVDIGALLGKESGTILLSHLGRKFIALKPSIVDYLQKIRRVPQIMLPKDAAQIVAHTSVGPGSLVVDAGAGSGALAIFLGHLVRPDGRVVSYEVREDFARIAGENVKRAGLSDIVEVKIKNVYDGIDETGVDLVTVDLPSPELVIPHAEKALKIGGYLAVFCPCMEHLQRIYPLLRAGRFAEIKTIECLVREIEVKEKCTRPSTRMIAHTGYLTFARRI